MAAIWWVTTIGFVLCLGFVGGTFFHFLRESLYSEDCRKSRLKRSENDSYYN